MTPQKRLFDLTLALVTATVLALPFSLLVAVLLIREGRPIFYVSERMRAPGRPFRLWKLRTMTVVQADSGVSGGDKSSRITATGRFLRRSRLDEIPQLWNVLRGDMSFVGPRPERPEFIAELTSKVPFYGQRHAVRPGLTGWAQVRHRYGASVDDSQEKLQYDLFYIKHMSFAFDLYIVLETVKTVLVRGGS